MATSVKIFELLQKKVRMAFVELFFIDKCLNNDIIPHFLEFRVPKTDFFSEQAVLNFKKRLLRDEMRKSKANLVQLL